MAPYIENSGEWVCWTGRHEIHTLGKIRQVNGHATTAIGEPAPSLDDLQVVERSGEVEGLLRAVEDSNHDLRRAGERGISHILGHDGECVTFHVSTGGLLGQPHPPCTGIDDKE